MILNTLLILFAVILSVLLLLARDWRYVILGLALVYLVGFILIVQIWPIALAAVKLVSGLMGVTLLAMIKSSSEEVYSQEDSLSARIFIFLFACLGWMIISATIARVNEWLPIPYTNLYVGLLILFTGILKTSLFPRNFEILVGLLVFLAGFDIIYSSLEGSALVTAIYALIVLLICVLGTYLEGAPVRREE